MTFIGRKSVSILAMLPMCFSLVTGARAQAPSNPTIRGFVVGAEYSKFATAYKASASLGQGTSWWFGYRPDIPQAPTTHAEVPIAYGTDGVYSGGFGSGDDWPTPLQHVVYNPSIANPGFNYLPAVDLFKHQTPYASNTGSYPGVTSLNVSASAQFPAETIVANGSHWGGFYGSFRGSNGTMAAQGFPWSSPGSDYGYYNAGDAGYKPYAPGPANVNFYIYDIRNSTPVVDSAGHATYDLTSAPDNVSATTNKARGRLTIRRKDFSARWEFGYSAANIQYANTFILQGVWEIAAVEGSFTSVYSPSDIGKAVGTYGQPQRFFPGLNYNDGNFYNVFSNSSNQQKSMVYQFLPAGVTIVRTYDAVTNTIVETVTNNGDVSLSNLTVTDTAAGTSAPFSLAAGASTTITLPLTVPYVSVGTATVKSNVFGIERGTDINGSSMTIADTSTNVSGVPDASIIHVSATSSGTQLASDITVSGVVTAQKAGASTGVASVTVTLTGTDLNGNAVSLTTQSAADGTYSFSNVVPGTYHVVETAPAGYDVLDAIPGVGATKVSATDLLVAANATGTSSYTSENFQLAQQVGTVSGTLYVDANKNTSLDSGEAGVAGITVTLQDGNGKAVATTTTDANGAYSFTAIPVGSYTVVAPATAGDDTLETGASLPVTVVSTKDAPNNNFGYLLPTGSLSGVLYVDANKNSALDGGEAGVSGITVILTDSKGKVVATTTTDANGSYSFAAITIGAYTVSAPALASGDTLETAATVAATVTANKETPNNNFGYLLPTGSLSGTFYIDGDKDSAFDNGEIGIAGVLVTLKDGTGKVVATTTTGADGSYSFTAITIGSYTVSAPAMAGDDTLETAATLAVTVAASKDTPKNNFGYLLPVGSLSGTLYVDANKNSAFDGGEAGLSGVTVTLTDSNGKVVKTATTDASGAYSFPGVTIGSYTVSAPATASGDTLETSATVAAIVTANKDTPNNNFGYLLPVGSLSGVLYVDANKNSSLDGGENGLAGITVTLTDANGKTVKTATTDANGSYSFSGVTIGAYTVTAPSTASGDTLETAGALTVNVAANKDTPNNNFGYLLPVGSLSGTFYIDANKNSGLDSGEAGLSGLTVNLIDATGKTVASTTTSANGAYSFTGITIGSYTVSGPASAGDNTLETAATIAVSVTANANASGNNFGYLPPVGSVSGTLFIDADRDSNLDTGEAGLSGITVNLLDASGNIVATTTTDSSGGYSFAGLAPAGYTVSAPSAASGYALETAVTLAVTVVANQNDGANDFGYVTPVGSLSGVLFLDGDKDGKYDAGEALLSGVTVTVKDSSGNVVATTTTDSDGAYSVPGLIVGSYTVSAPTATGGDVLETSAALTVAVTANVDAPNNNFGYVIPVGSVSGTLYIDANKNGALNSGEAGVSGVTVNLLDGAGNIVATTTTDGSGNYSFADVVTGAYTVSAPAAAGGANIETSGSLSVTVTASQNSGGNNFGYVVPAIGSLSGTLYIDTNKNSGLDSGEAGISGVTVNLVDASGSIVATTTTDSSGKYSFTGLAAGSYKVVAPGAASSYALETSGTLSVTVVGSQNSGNNNFGYVKPAPTVGSICGVVYLDTNKDGKPGCGDYALSGVTVTLVDGNGKVVATTTTDCSGGYSFKNVPAGTYKVVVPATDGVYPVETTDPLTVTVTGGQNVCNVNFGYVKPATGNLCGTVYIDGDKDGRYGRGETVLSGVTVTLVDGNGKTVAVTTTDCSGNYTFRGLAPGSYKVVVPAKNGSYPIETTDPLAVTVVGNQTSSGNNFGYVKPATGNVCGTVYLDTNKDGKPNNGDTALSGVTVTLVDSSGKTVATTVTDCSGGYTFKNVTPGVYTVVVPGSASGDSIETTNPLSVTVSGNQTSGNVNFGYTKSSASCGSLCGTVFYDSNKNGKFDRCDTALCGVLVTLKNNSGKTIATTKSDSCGNYSFSGVPAGSYAVCAPSSLSSCSPKSGANLNCSVSGGQKTGNCNFAYVKGSSWGG
ncbi:hypothetical protein CCAX7_58280 [Capsulimonas corticalis]|uniref:SD-repeat containing protein B domain-containing protein n=1 Tax=Capsulimonas corticalis TaxID=2219043 RepID=A0A402D011_9BACT|nr:SdrD B-like domain-containing protein [Capsulimonas corticalis]BDI33777.1 hypothetical protein CCAX7_58280 [Capsulimonas corticalis]